MKFDFEYNTLEFIKFIAKNAQKQNIRVFFVGGAVRDSILNIPIKDLDFIVEGDAIDFINNITPKIVIKSIHKDFSTVKVLWNDLEFDIASTRTEKYPYSGCLPVVDEVGVNIEKDYLRRDFTVNSLYCEIKIIDNEVKYNLIDFSTGLSDIKTKTLRVFHNKSYIDDPSRIIRGVDFKYRFGFDFSCNDKNLISNYLKNIDNSNMSIARIQSVFEHVLDNKNADKIFLEIIKKNYYRILNNTDINFNLKNYNKTKKLFKNFINSSFYMNILKNNQPELIQTTSLIDIYKAFSKTDLNFLAYYFYKTQDKNAAEYLKIKDIKLNVSGRDLIVLGYSEGKKIGEILEDLLEKKLLNPSLFTDKKTEIEYILNCFHKM